MRRDRWKSPEDWPLLADSLVLLVFVSSLSFAVWRLVGPMSGPIIFEDELGPIETARTLIGQQAVADSKYFPGYALLLTPAVWLADSAFGEYRASLLTNVGLLAVGASLVYVLLRQLKAGGRREVVLMTSVVVGSPYVLSSAGLLWSEIALVVLAILLAFVMVHAVDNSSLQLSALFGMVAGGSVLFHPRMSVAVGAGLLALFSSSRGSRIRLIVPFMIGAAVGICLAVLAREAIIDLVGSSAYGSPNTSISVQKLKSVVEVSIGRVSTEMLALAGLPVIALATPSLRTRAAQRPILPLWIFGISFVAGQLALALLTSGEFGRVDFLYYTRYQGPGAVVLALASVLTLAGVDSASRRPSSDYVVGTLTAILCAGVVLSLVVDRTLFNTSFVLANIPELGMLGGDFRAFRVYSLIAIVVGIGLLASCSGASTGRVLSLILAFNIFNSVAWYDAFAWPGSAGRADQRALVPYVEGLASSECVSVDIATVPFWNAANVAFFTDAGVSSLDLTADEPCGGLIITGRPLPARLETEFDLLATDPILLLDLYVKRPG